MDLTELQNKTSEELISLASEMEIDLPSAELKKLDLLTKVIKSHLSNDGKVFASGVLSILNDGYGFLRRNTGSHSGDVYVSQSQIRRIGLRPGDVVSGHIRPPKDGERYFGLLRAESVNGIDPEKARSRPKFESLTPIFPVEQILLETNSKNYSTRLMDMLSPVGRGQRGLIVAPPKAGKTTLLKNIAEGISANAPDVTILVALIGERPEEVTDMTRSIKGEVYSSTFDEPVEDHCRVAEMVLERAKRMVEVGKSVVILLDSITRLTRAYNLAVPNSGRTLSGGIDPIALYPPKKFFGAARNTEEGGSLTVLAACLVETGSRMDDVIYEEFKGTGNMEVHLDRNLSEARVFPAIDISRSGTRREELLIPEDQLRQIWLLRRMVSMISSDSIKGTEATEKVLEQIKKTKTNEDFLKNLTRSK